MTTVALVDDHALVREGMKSLLNAHDGMAVVGEAGSLESAFSMIDRARPDVVITDIKLGDGSGIELCRTVKSQFDTVRIIVLSAYWTDALVREAFEARADGYLLKSSESFDLARTVAAVNGGESVVAPELAAALFRSQSSRTAGPDSVRLTVRERELLELVVLGLTNQAIALRLVLSPHTVKGYLGELLTKFGASNRTELTRLALLQGALGGPDWTQSKYPPIRG